MRDFSFDRLGRFFVRALLGAILLSSSAVWAGESDEVAPAPPSIGADVPLTYFGPAPSQVQKELIGPYQFLKSGTLDQDAATITLPLYRGETLNGKNIWYVVTDTTDKFNAEGLGINHAPKLAYADVGKGARTARITKLKEGLGLIFNSGTVDFKPERAITPGNAPDYFPPKSFQPGSVGDANYSPLVKVVNGGGHIYNAPVVAFDVSAKALNKFCKGSPDYKIVHDKVVSICPEEATVTLALTTGFSFARPVLYLSTEANDPLPATLEGSTYAPGLRSIPTGGDDSLFSAVERLFLAVNGPVGKENPQRQGLNSALSDGGSPLSVLGGIPTIATDYSPLWDVNPYVWTKEAIDKGYRSRLYEEFDILGKVQRGWLTGLDGKEFGSVGFIVNCPIVFRFL